MAKTGGFTLRFPVTERVIEFLELIESPNREWGGRWELDVTKDGHWYVDAEWNVADNMENALRLRSRPKWFNTREERIEWNWGLSAFAMAANRITKAKGEVTKSE